MKRRPVVDGAATWAGIVVVAIGLTILTRPAPDAAAKGSHTAALLNFAAAQHRAAVQEPPTPEPPKPKPTPAEERLEIEGEYVLTVTKLPVTIAGPKGVIAWKHRDAVLAVENGHKLEIHGLPKGDSLISARCQHIDFQAESFELHDLRIVLRNGVGDRGDEDGDDDDENPTPALSRVVIVEETAQRTQDQARVLLSIRATPTDYPVAIVDKDSTAPQHQDAITAVGRSYPACVFYGGDTRLGVEPLPADYAQYEKLLDKYKG